MSIKKHTEIWDEIESLIEKKINDKLGKYGKYDSNMIQIIICL